MDGGRAAKLRSSDLEKVMMRGVRGGEREREGRGCGGGGEGDAVGEEEEAEEESTARCSGTRSSQPHALPSGALSSHKRIQHADLISQ